MLRSFWPTPRWRAWSTAALCGAALSMCGREVRAETPSTIASEQPAAAELTVDAAVALALAQSPELREALALQVAAESAAQAPSRWPDPELEYRLWAQPLSRPLAFDEAQMHMLGVRQALPAPGVGSARAESEAARARSASHTARARRLEVVARTTRAFAQYYVSERQYRLHLEHAELARQLLEVARAAYQSGRGSQGDVLRASLELSRLHQDVSDIEAERAAARGLLNTLLGRAVDAPLPPPAALKPQELAPTATSRSAPEQPEMAAGRESVAAASGEVEASRAAGAWPSFMVGADYMYMPMAEPHHNYGLMLSMSVPWLNPRYDEERRAAEARVSAERAALEGTRRALDYERYAASQRYGAARRALTNLESELLPQAERQFEAARASFRGGELDSRQLLEALRTLLDLRIERERTIGRVLIAVADWERAVGHDFSPASERTRHAKP